MSYILDALKKSEQQRQRSKGISFQSPVLVPYTEKANSPLIYVLTAAFLLGLLIIGSWLYPWHSQEASQLATTDAVRVTTAEAPHLQDTSQQAQAPQAIPKPMASTSIKPFSSSAVVANVKNTKPALRETSKAIPTSLKEALQVPVNVEPVSIAPSTQPPPAPPSIDKAAPQEDVTATESHETEIPLHNRLLELSELPPNILQDIPDMSIAGYVFSENPKERSVGINGRLLQEGDYIKQGVRLEHIAPEGLIFSYKSYHFRQSLQ